MIVAVDYLEDKNLESIEVKALNRALISEMKQVSENNPLFSEEMRLNMVNIDHPGKIADFVASILNISSEEKQNILETIDVQERIERVLVFIKKEQELLRIQKKIQSQLNEKIEKSQREYFLKEQLKAIKVELGMASDAKSSQHKKLIEIFNKINFQGEVKERIEEEMEKFSVMDSNSPEFIVTRNYLETIASLPWSQPERKKIDLNHSQEILNEDHYGLEEVKERILEFLAVQQLQNEIFSSEIFKGSIICLVGPPGVGKTSVGKSIARSLGRKFFRFSVGGMRDEAEIKGHRRTYIGAMPGKILQGLRIVKTANPVFMIDEIDKLGSSFQGDPSSALLEVLDPEQNNSFRDHYLDLPFDISSVMFITTANTLETIPVPLLDRMEIIRLPGYIEEEKVQIARKYLIPRSLERAGLKKKDLKYDSTSLRIISDNYAREAGMRTYEKALDKIHRKIAKELILGSIKPPVKVSKSVLKHYLGRPVFIEENRNRITGPGMVKGLAWTTTGGAVLMIEIIANSGKGGIKLTGQMGDVMQESANIAYSYSRILAKKYGAKDNFFQENSIHIHIPAGATPKDGPSAGVTMASALLSLILKKKLKQSIAMTGELSLAGKILPIGGLKEKVIAAKRNSIREIIIPQENLRDMEEIPEKTKKGIKFHLVDSMEQVAVILF